MLAEAIAEAQQKIIDAFINIFSFSFKEFKNRYLRPDLDQSTRHQVLTSYLVLQDSSRKFYDLALKQQKSNKTINPKYLAIVER